MGNSCAPSKGRSNVKVKNAQQGPPPAALNFGVEPRKKQIGGSADGLRNQFTPSDRVEDSKDDKSTPVSVDAPKEPSQAGPRSDLRNRDLLGVSVYHLEEVFLKDVESTGDLSRKSTIYDIENLDGAPGVIRKKGEHILDEATNQLGAAYVDCLEGEDNVGQSTHMLSYTWGYQIGQIVDTLHHFCVSKSLDPKRTYIWICCLCENQHRIAEARRSGKNVMTDELIKKFESRVLGIGSLLVMMAPWDNPSYVQRIWCIFEFSKASQCKTCDVNVVMPPQEKEKLTFELLSSDGSGLDTLYMALSKIKVEEAKASVADDQKMILEVVREGGAGFFTTNFRVNERLRVWVRSIVEEIAQGATLDPLSLASFCNVMGGFFSENQDLDAARAMHEKALSSIKSILPQTPNAMEAATLTKLADIADKKGEYNRALDEYRMVLAIQEGIFPRNHPDIVETHGKVGLILAEKGDLSGALKQHRKALDIQEHVFGKGDPHTASSHNNTASVLQELGEYGKAESEYQHALDAASSKTIPSSAINRSISYCGIGTVFALQGKYDEAMEKFHESIDVYEGKQGKDHPGTARMHVEVGKILTLKGKYSEALGEFYKVLAVVGMNHPETAPTYCNIGSILAETGDLDGAERAFRNALVIQEVALDVHHPDTAATHNHIGRVLQDKGIYSEALAEYQIALDIQKEAFGELHSSVATTHKNIGDVLQDMGNYVEASSELRESISIQESMLGKGHPSLATAYSNFGSIRQEMGDFDGALEEYQKALAIRESVLGADHPETATTYNQIGGVLRAKGDLNGALDVYRKALLYHESTLGSLHPATAATYNNIGTILRAQGDLDGALAQYQRYLNILESILGKDHPSTAIALNNIGDVLRDKGDLDGALVKYQEALRIRENALGTNHPETATTFNNLGCVFKAAGKLDGALVNYQKALAVQEPTLGQHHPSTAATYNNIAHVLCDKGDLEGALVQFRKVLTSQALIFGEHPNTATAHVSVGAVLQRMGDLDQALAEFRKALAIQEKTLGKLHPSTVETSRSIELVLAAKG